MQRVVKLPTEYYRTGATLSDDGRYRYLLRRDWAPCTPADRITWIMLNPSTADADIDDATIRRCVGYSKAWGFKGLYVVNLFGYRATDPRALLRVPDPIGKDNLHYMTYAVANCTRVMIAYGAGGRIMNRHLEVLQFLKRMRKPAFCLGLTSTGMPKHPLRLAKSLRPVRYADVQV